MSSTFNLAICIISIVCCLEKISCSTTYNVPWNLAYLQSISNEINVTIGDKILLTCNNSLEEVFYGDEPINFNSCLSNCSVPIGACELNGQIIVQIKYVLIACQPSFPADSVKYLVNKNVSSCLRLKVNVHDISTTTTTSTPPPATGTDGNSSEGSTGGGDQTSNGQTGSQATPTSSGGSSPSHTPNASSSPCCTVTASESPSVGFGETSSNRIFIDWGTGPQIGLIGGVAVVLLILIGVGVCVVVLIMKNSGRSSESKNFPRDNSTALMLEDTDSGKTGKFASSNKVEPVEVVTSPKRPPPDPPTASTNNGVKQTNGKQNGVVFNNKSGQVSLASGGGKRTAPPPPSSSSRQPPPLRVTQSVQNYNKKSVPHYNTKPLKSV